MQNKGFVRLIAVALALICLFYLSFSVVTSHHNKKANEYANGSNELYYRYMDSLSSNKVWLGYTLKECREKELNLGLDLKGGMNVTLEVSVMDIVRALSDYNTNENFNNALVAARERQKQSGADFLNLFQEEFEKQDPNARLSAIFSTLSLKDKVQLSSTNEEVIKVLRGEVEAAIDNSFNVLRSRIDRFGVVQPNIQKLDIEGRILVELPGIKEPERVRKLLQGSANLEFWETYDASELAEVLMAANNVLRDIEKTDNANAETAEAEVETTEEVVAEETSAVDDATEAAIAAVVAEEVATDAEKEAEEATEEETIDTDNMANNPLFALLNMTPGGRGPVIGIVASKDTARVMEMFNRPQVKRLLPRGLMLRWTVKPEEGTARTGEKVELYSLVALKCNNRDGRAPLAGDVITDANPDFDQMTGRATVNMKMNNEGAQTWARLTKANIGKAIAITLDNYVYSFPNVRDEITGGNSEISGQFTVEEAKDLANVLKSGKMPAPARIVQEDVVGPSLGQEAIHNGLISFIIAFCLVLIYMIFYYGLIPGLIADVALLCNVFFMFGILASFGAVLTLPGIAGIVLTLGMSVDANVLIYERIREELRSGKQLHKAVNDGYSNAFSAIFDSNITTILTGAILFWFGSGPIKGFATTLIVGIVTSFFTAIFLSHLIYERLLKKNKERNIPFTTNLTKNWFQNTNINFVENRKKAYLFSGVILLTCIISLFTLGLKRGIDFSGGRNFVVRFENTVNAEDIREDLSHVFPESQTSVITMGASNQVRISTNYGIDNDNENMDNQIEEMLYEGLKKYMNEAVTLEMFKERYTIENGTYARSLEMDNKENFGIQSSQKVGPTIADDIKTSAVWSIIAALIVIGLYILLRFRNYAFSVGAVVSLIHDTLFVIGVYSLLYKVMPFSLEIDQSFIAAILTIVGYSINDTVVIFDRVRENMTLYPKRKFAGIVNHSLNSTLSRTFSTSMSTFVVLLAIFIFGGETIRGFVFALLLGVVVGTYSSLFIAAPVAYELRIRQKKVKEIEANAD
ncbi:MAG: protein translocase subunit SecDF [Bacteroidales bacterium]|nr:protein translocase subunit SecDF [Bacteroidales bacterium]